MAPLNPSAQISYNNHLLLLFLFFPLIPWFCNLCQSQINKVAGSFSFLLVCSSPINGSFLWSRTNLNFKSFRTFSCGSVVAFCRHNTLLDSSYHILCLLEPLLPPSNGWLTRHYSNTTTSITRETKMLVRCSAMMSLTRLVVALRIFAARAWPRFSSAVN